MRYERGIGHLVTGLDVDSSPAGPRGIHVAGEQRARKSLIVYKRQIVYKERCFIVESCFL